MTLAFVGHPATGKLVTDDTVAARGAEAECDVALRQGDPAVEIMAVANEVHADLIVVGNKGGREALLPEPGAGEGRRPRRP